MKAPDYVPKALREEFAKHLTWFEENLKVFDKNNARIAPLRFTNIQQACEWVKWSRMREKLPVFLLILKARQHYISTWSQATCFKDALEFDGRRTMTVAYDDDSTREMLDRTKFFHESYLVKCDHPGQKEGKSCKVCNDTGYRNVETDKDSVDALRFVENRSEVRISTAGGRQRTGRGFYAHAVHFSEMPYYAEGRRTYTAAMSSVSDRFPTVVIVEFTAQGPGDFAHELWQAAQDGTNEFIPLFFPWFMHDEYRRPVSAEDVARRSPKEWLSHNEDILRAWGLTTVAGRKEKKEEDHERRAGKPGNPPAERSGPGEAGVRADASGADREGGSHREGAHGPEGAGDGVAIVLEGSGAARLGPVRRTPQATGRDPGEDPRSRTHDRYQRRILGLRETGPDPRVWERMERFSDGTGDRVPREELIASPLKALSASMTPYERGLVEQHGLTMEQINWRRYCLHHTCAGDEGEMRRDYPATPEEAFEASGADILDPYVIAKWEKYAEEHPGIRGRFSIEETLDVDRQSHFSAKWETDENGLVTLYEPPDREEAYIMAIDPSEGFTHSDWQIATVIALSTGEQVAEYRGRLHPDIAIDQMEGLGLHYNKAFTIVEVNSGGRAFYRLLAKRATLPMYEREGFDKVGGIRHPIKKGGWFTDDTNRKELFTVLRASVRDGRCRIRSKETLRECRTLWERPISEHKGKIEARKGYHDDGVMAHAIAVNQRSKLLGQETQREKEERQTPAFLEAIFQQAERKRLKAPQIQVRIPTKTVSVSAASLRVDGKRSWL